MVDIETRLREAMRAEAERVAPGQLRPGRPVAPRRGRMRAGLVPVAAALAIAVLLTVVTTVVRDVGILHPASTGSASLGDAFSGLPWPVSNGQTPENYVSIDYGNAIHFKGAGSYEVRMTAVVHSSAIGTVLRSVPLPGLNEASDGPPLITAAGDDRHFVIALPTGRGLHPPTRFYLLTIGSAGRSASLKPLPVHPTLADAAVTGIALTPDGTKLAIGLGGRHAVSGGGTAAIEVINLVTGATHTWAIHIGRFIDAAGPISGLAWGDAGRMLSFGWNLDNNSPAGGVYLLNPATRRGLLDDRFIPGRSIRHAFSDGYLNPSGDTVVADLNYPRPPGDHELNDGYPAIAELSAQTGNLIRMLYGPARRPTPIGYEVVSIDPSGRHLLVATGGFGRLDNGRFTPLPGSSTTEAAW